MSLSALFNRKVLITAGPTREAIDPVRFISNHSSGKMGYAIANCCLQQGALVTLISGPVYLDLQHPNLTLVKVESAADMWMAGSQHFQDTDMAIFAAAVADYRPAQAATRKIKKKEDVFTIRMVKNTDIAFEFGKNKSRRQVAVGFALETNDELANAAAKLKKKHLDMIVLNSLNDEQAGFGYDTNKITIIKDGFSPISLPLQPKMQVAEEIVFHAGNCLTAKLAERANETV